MDSKAAQGDERNVWRQKGWGQATPGHGSSAVYCNNM